MKRRSTVLSSVTLVLAAVGLVSIAASANAQDPLFAPPVNYWVGACPWSVFSADLDGDNDNDLAMANYHSHNVSILLNNGDEVVFANGIGTGDGDVDIATVNQSSNNVSTLFSATAALEKPPYNGPQNTPNPSKQGGDTFDDAIQITVIPDTLIGTTEGFNDDYDEVCPHSGSTSPDVVYYFDCSFDTTVKISLCNAGTDYDTKIYVYEDSYTPGNPYACNDDACPGYVSEIFGLDLFGGHTYYIVIDGYGGDFGNYELTIDGFYPCDSFPAGWGDCIDENEPCGDDNNPGCGGFPPAWEPINCGDTVCGTVWAEGGTRDTDWYSLILTETKLVTFTAEGEFPMTIGFVDTADCNLFTGLDPYALSVYPCSLLTTSRIAGPGVYWLHLSVNNYYDYPCGTANNYYMTITCEMVQVYICGDIDGSGAQPNVADLTYLVDYLFFGGPEPPVMEAANVDGEGGINVADLTYLVDYLFFSGPEPICGPIK